MSFLKLSLAFYPVHLVSISCGDRIILRRHRSAFLFVDEVVE